MPSLHALTDREPLIQSLETLHNAIGSIASQSGCYSKQTADLLESHFQILEVMRKRVEQDTR